MALLTIGLATIFALLFGLLVLATLPADPEKIVRQRLAAIPVHSAREAAREAQASDPASQVLKEGEEFRRGSLHWLLMNYASAEILRRCIAQGGGTETPSGVFLVSVGLAAGGCAVAWFFAPVLPLALAGGAITGVTPSIYIFWRRSKRVAAFAAGLPEAIDMMARALRAGHSMAAAIEIVSLDAPEPVAAEFGEVFQQQNFGLPLREALLRMLERVPSQDLRVLLTAIIVQRDTGGNLIELLDRAAFLIRDRVRLRGEIRTHTAQGRMTGWVLCALPVVMLVLTNIINPGYSNVLFSDPFGRKLIYGGIGLLAAGSLVIHRIVNGIDL
jgi:tight adherence protein B